MSRVTKIQRYVSCYLSNVTSCCDDVARVFCFLLLVVIVDVLLLVFTFFLIIVAFA